MTPAEFKAAFPEFAALADAAVQTVIDASAPFFDLLRWDDLLPAGVGNWVAHTLLTARMNSLSTTAQMAGGADESAAISKRAGDTEIKWSPAVALFYAQARPYASTAYGRVYLDLARMVGSGATAV